MDFPPMVFFQRVLLGYSHMKTVLYLIISVSIQSEFINVYLCFPSNKELLWTMIQRLLITGVQKSEISTNPDPNNNFGG